MLNRIHATAPHVISHITQCGRPRQRPIRNPRTSPAASRPAPRTHTRSSTPIHTASHPAPHTHTYQDTPVRSFASRTAHIYAPRHTKLAFRDPHRARLRATSCHTASHRPIPRTCTRQDTPVQRLVTRIAHLYAPRVATQLPNVPYRAPIRAKTPQSRIPRPTQRTYAHPDTLIRRTTSHTAHAYASSSLAATFRVLNSVPMRIRIRANPALHRGQRSRILPMAIAVLSTKASRGSVASQPVVSAARLSR